MYFSDNPSDRYYERMMVGIPNFKPRGHGLVIVGNRPTEPLVILRIQDGTATHREILTETTQAINHRRFRHRLNKYLKESEMNPMRYKNEKHQSEFEDAIRKKDKKDYAMMAALYLLTADLHLWNLSKRHVGKISIIQKGHGQQRRAPEILHREQPSCHHRCSHLRQSPRGTRKTCRKAQDQKGRHENRARQILKQIRHDRTARLRRMQDTVPQMHMDGKRAKEDCVEMYQSA